MRIEGSRVASVGSCGEVLGAWGRAVTEAMLPRTTCIGSPHLGLRAGLLVAHVPPLCVLSRTGRLTKINAEAKPGRRGIIQIKYL